MRLETFCIRIMFWVCGVCGWCVGVIVDFVIVDIVRT